MNDREFWIAIRAALLGIVSAIERRWEIGPIYQRKALESPDADNFGG